MATTALTVLGTILLLAGLVATTISLLGFLRLPTLQLRLHALSVGSGVGVVAVLTAAIATAIPAIVARAALVALFVMITAPLASHTIARAARHRDQ